LSRRRYTVPGFWSAFAVFVLGATPAFAQSGHILDGSACNFSGDMGAHLGSGHGIYPAAAGESGWAYSSDFVFKTSSDCERVRTGGIVACEKLRANCGTIASCSPRAGTGSSSSGGGTGSTANQEVFDKAIYEGLKHGGNDGAQLFGLGVLGKLITSMPSGDGGRAKAEAAERARLAEEERQRQAAEAARIAEEKRLAELERLRLEELERQRIFNAEKNGLAGQFKGTGGGLTFKDEGTKVASAAPCLSQPLLRFTKESDEKYAWREKQRQEGCSSKPSTSGAFVSLQTPTPTPTPGSGAPVSGPLPPQTSSPDWGKLVDDEPANGPAPAASASAPRNAQPEPDDAVPDDPPSVPRDAESDETPAAAGTAASLNQPDWSKVASGTEENVSMEARKPFDTAGEPLVVPRPGTSGGKTTSAASSQPRAGSPSSSTSPSSAPAGTVASAAGSSLRPMSFPTSQPPNQIPPQSASPVSSGNAPVVVDTGKAVAMIPPPRKPSKKPVLRLQKVPPVIGATRELELQVDDVSGGGECVFEWTATDALSLSPDPKRAPNSGTLRSTATFVANSLGIGTIEVRCRGSAEVMASGNLYVQPPILFVHGINSDASTWNAMRNELVARGFVNGKTLVKGGGPASSADFYTCSFSNNMGDWFQEAPELKDFIDRILSRIPFKEKPPVVLVAHSMGGLASRAYLQGNAGISPQEAAAKVGALVTIGTPHRGSFMAQLHYSESVLKVLAREVLGGEKGIEALAVTSPQIKNLNANVGKIGGLVRHVSIVTVVPQKDANAFRAVVPKVLKGRPLTVAALAIVPFQTGMTLDPLAEFAADPGYQLADNLPPLFDRSDSLVDVASQDLNSVKHAPRSIRIDGGIAEHLMQTKRTDLLFRGLKETGFFPNLEALPQTLCWSPSGVPELISEPTNVELFGMLGDGHALVTSEAFQNRVLSTGNAPAALMVAGGKAMVATMDRAQASVATVNDDYLAKATALKARGEAITALQRAGKIDNAEALKRRNALRVEALALWRTGSDGRFGTKEIAWNALRSDAGIAAGGAGTPASSNVSSMAPSCSR